MSFKTTYTLWGGLIGGALLSAARMAPTISSCSVSSRRATSRREEALVGSGIFVIAQFALFLLWGRLCGWQAPIGPISPAAGLIYPTFVIEHLPSGLAGLVVAAILAAAMSTVASSLNSLASASPTTSTHRSPGGPSPSTCSV